MKKTILFLLAVAVLICSCSCNTQNHKSTDISTLEPTPAPTASVTPAPTSTPEPTNAPVSYNEDVFTKNSDGTISLKDIDLNTDGPSILKKDSTVSESDNNIDIPVYNPEYITYGSCGGFFPCIDHGMWNSFSVYSDYLMYVQTVYPSNAWRKTDDNRYYVMYDVTDGSRIYVFFDGLDNNSRVLGYPILMKKSISYDKLADIKLGDDISKVIDIDPAAQYTKNIWDKATDNALEYYQKYDNPPVSVHLLTDGIMRITYERTGEEGSYAYTITNIVYNEDFNLKGIAGTINYQIAEMDYVE